MWSRSKKARREATLAAAVQIRKCKAELDNLKAELDKLRRPKKNDQLAIDGKNEPSVKLAKMDQLDEEGRKISELLQSRQYDLEREVRIAEVARTPQLLSAKPSADPACKVVSSSLLDAARTGLRSRSTVAQPRQAHNLAIALETRDHLSGRRFRFARALMTPATAAGQGAGDCGENFKIPVGGRQAGRCRLRFEAGQPWLPS